jgi:sigma-54 dependent transcriptional regulator, acetoin dehydrogenase operon transcriptional activator AcoR
MKNKTVCVVANHPQTARLYREQIDRVVGKNLFIEDISCDQIGTLRDGFQATLDRVDIIVLSCKPIRKKLAGFDLRNKKIIVANTILNDSCLMDLIRIPMGRDALVVTGFKETALHVIELLKKYGFGEMHYIPYYPGTRIKTDGVSLAITTGAKYYVPDHITEVYDIGIRKIDISTMVQILLAADLALPRVDEISRKYIFDLIELSAQFKRLTTKVTTLNTYLKAVVEASDVGIIAVDENDRVVEINATAAKICGLKQLDYTGLHAKEILPELSTSFIHWEKDFSDKLLTINNQKVLLTSLPISFDQHYCGRLFNIRSVDHVKKLEREIRMQSVRDGHVAKHRFENIVGISTTIRGCIQSAEAFAQTNSTILISGESGTGKELFAHSIHNQSQHWNGPFVAVNFAALPTNLVESELFGYEEGAFTGARKGGKPGLFEMAHNGTIFLDEIGDASLEIQTRLLRVLEEYQVRKIGSNKIITVNIRVIVATNRNLHRLVEQGEFRHDLLYRLNTLPLVLPPLRERKEDILLFVRLFQKKYFGKDFPLPYEIIRLMFDYPWPGNIRELEHAVEFLCMQFRLGKIDIRSFRNTFLRGTLSKIGKIEQNNQANLETLFHCFSRQEYINILRVLKTGADHSSIGRKQIIEKTRSKCPSLTEARTRNLLKELSHLGFVRIGKTRQGTKITQSGIQFQESLEQKSNSLLEV